MVTPALERLVSQCLAKDPEERWQSARDVGRELDWIARGGSEAGVPAPVAARRKAGLRISWIVAGVSALVAVACLALLIFHRPPEPVAGRFSILRPAAARSMSWPRLSPDGKLLAFQGTDSLGHNVIWVRALNSLEPVALAGTEGAGRPFWSPDSRNLAYFIGDQLRKVPATGGPPQLIAEVKNGSDGCWGAGDVIVFDGGQSDSIQQVSALGGEVHPASFLERRHGDLFHAWPQFLPDGRHFLFLSRLKSGKFEVAIGQVGAHDSRRCGLTETRAEFVDPGYLIYGSSGTLMARRLDAGSGKFTGEAFPVADRVSASSEVMQFSCSRNGELAYMPQRSAGQKVLQWLDRSGKVLETVGQPGLYFDLALSRDGKKLLYGGSDVARLRRHWATAGNVG